MPYQTERKRELFMAEKMRDGKVRCSFCHKSEDQVRKLIAGPEGVFICDECIGICSEIMEEELGDYDHVPQRPEGGRGADGNTGRGVRHP